jgi:hypothetical protein
MYMRHCSCLIVSLVIANSSDSWTILDANEANYSVGAFFISKKSHFNLKRKMFLEKRSLRVLIT